MSILSGFKKIEKYIKQSSGYQKISQWTSAESVEFHDGSILEDKMKELDNIYLKKTGDIMSGTLTLSKTTDLTETNNNNPALIAGGTATTQHMEMDHNKLQAKANETTPNPLYINSDGGKLNLGKAGKVSIEDGVLTAETIVLGTTPSDKVGAMWITEQER